MQKLIWLRTDKFDGPPRYESREGASSSSFGISSSLASWTSPCSSTSSSCSDASFTCWGSYSGTWGSPTPSRMLVPLLTHPCTTARSCLVWCIHDGIVASKMIEVWVHIWNKSKSHTNQQKIKFNTPDLVLYYIIWIDEQSVLDNIIWDNTSLRKNTNEWRNAT